MITSKHWRGKRYAVLGLARSGLATVDALLAAGAEVTAWDSSEAARDALSPSPLRGEGRGEGPIDNASHLPLSQPSPQGGEGLKLADPLSLNLAGFAGVIVSPGVPLNRHPIAAHAAKFSVPVIGDVELFAQARTELPAHKVVGVTGTNGKSTTTALIDHICRTAGLPSLAGGNIGLPILGRDPLPEGGVYVLELSSYQIDLTRSLDCDVAVLLNITPDHLDRYDGFEAYAASKARLFAMQSRGHAAVIGIGDAPSAEIARQVAASGRSEDLHKIAPGVCMDQSRWPALQGPHNAQNALAAIAACEALGVDRAAIDKGLETFPGLPHRMERVATRNGVLFVNDSKATNADSTTPALSAYPRVHWILGGRAKTESLEACRPGFGHVVKAYTIGEAGDLFARLLEGEMPVERSGTLEVAVKSAAANARPGDTVLLSPACASFDQFKDYEARGQAFRDAVDMLG
ncbi:UDP-N-acetylmuramoyl-L-alanine--D-glutamate ligase [Sphingomonas psychrotolerans]|uniref:UDP-N-acetylmuramoylalanine--D-glutamate ligase n=1 Tax=Sphingomonas psychrotolerans TaxID=1327635 RepID=A0ABU3MY92_9SPHN|nr:UDP-N-acetylmuramoyl-L-alanine--D-glutamate ligase [Sphingomonas psychrotolerans]MDT8757285.1 UDP-N-acetylmuramoyl-L-alanine--D-glutamate ligase [Sphingomonas psychrotolerans]